MSAGHEPQQARAWEMRTGEWENAAGKHVVVLSISVFKGKIKILYPLMRNHQTIVAWLFEIILF